MLNIALYEPEIPPNTGNIIRLCANVGVNLHLIKPFGFDLDDKKLRRAGLDYHEFSSIVTYENWDEFQLKMKNHRIFACSTHAKNNYHQVKYLENDVLLFGPETRGLPADLRLSLPENQVIKIPMKTNSRSMNLSNAVAIITMEALRQLDFKTCD